MYIKVTKPDIRNHTDSFDVSRAGFDCGLNGAIFKYRSQQHIFRVFDVNVALSLHHHGCAAPPQWLVEDGDVRWHQIGLRAFLENPSTSLDAISILERDLSH